MPLPTSTLWLWGPTSAATQRSATRPWTSFCRKRCPCRSAGPCVWCWARPARACSGCRSQEASKRSSAARVPVREIVCPWPRFCPAFVPPTPHPHPHPHLPTPTHPHPPTHTPPGRPSKLTAWSAHTLRWQRSTASSWSPTRQGRASAAWTARHDPVQGAEGPTHGGHLRGECTCCW